MTGPDHNDLDPAVSAFHEHEGLREKTRFTLLIRSAKLTCDRGEFLCVIRDVSEGGVKLRLFHPIPGDGGLSLELATGDRFKVERVWHNHGLAGFRFSDSIDIPRFITEASPFPKRSLRLRMKTPAAVKVGELLLPAVIRDLSRDGIGIETDGALAIDQKVTLQAEGFGPRTAAVRWRKSPAYGLAMQDLLSFEALARTAARMQLPPNILGDLGAEDELRHWA
ncbi:MAG: PilZ domain-containing protein [Sphingomonadaceae bacterium]|nr:PilZ domain-containing protein [Sphingomonadaceae bacterium]